MGFKSAVVGTCYGSAASAVVYKCVNSLLKHSFLVANDYFGRAEFKKLLKTVISVDNTSVEVVKVGGCKSAAVELNHRTDIRRNYGDCVKNHPLGTVARRPECLGNFKSFKNTNLFLACRCFKLSEKLGAKL